MTDPRQLSNPDAIQALGSGSSNFSTAFDVPANESLLERFPNPMSPVLGTGIVQLGGFDDPKEFTSLCPKTGQPDFARIVVRYRPGDWCVESKSWKLYLGSYRTCQEFHEACVARICRDLVALLEPEWLLVRGEFTPRGGISINPEMEYSRPRRELRPGL